MPKRQEMKQSKETPGPMTDRLLGQRVRARRMELKISQTELGARCGVTLRRLWTAASMSSLGERKDGPSRFRDFLATKDGVDIMNAMLKLQQPHRRAVIEPARKLT